MTLAAWMEPTGGMHRGARSWRAAVFVLPPRRHPTPELAKAAAERVARAWIRRAAPAGLRRSSHASARGSIGTGEHEAAR